MTAKTGFILWQCFPKLFKQKVFVKSLNFKFTWYLLRVKILFRHGRLHKILLSFRGIFENFWRSSPYYDMWKLIHYTLRVWLPSMKLLQEALREISSGIFNNYSSSPKGLWVDSPWGRRPKGCWLIGYESERINCFSKIQLVGENKCWD